MKGALKCIECQRTHVAVNNPDAEIRTKGFWMNPAVPRGCEGAHSELKAQVSQLPP